MWRPAVLTIVVSRSLICLFLAVVLPCCQGQMEVARILNQPQFMIIPLNTVQEYSCSGIATFITWEVDNLSIDAEQRAKGFDDTGDTILDEQIPNLRTRELAVDGNSETNNSVIVCFAVLLSPPASTFAASNSVQVLVLDNLERLESVNNLTVTHLNSTAFLILWTPPFTLDGLPIHGYNVTITNTFNGQSMTFFVENTTLVYVIDNPDPNYDFTVTVFPINAVGPGEFVVIQVPKFVFSTTILPTSLILSTAVLTTHGLSMLPSASGSPGLLTDNAKIGLSIFAFSIFASMLTFLVILFVILWSRRKRKKCQVTLQIQNKSYESEAPANQQQINEQSSLSDQHKEDTDDLGTKVPEDNTSECESLTDINDTRSLLGNERKESCNKHHSIYKIPEQETTPPKKYESAPVTGTRRYDYSENVYTKSMEVPGQN